MSESQQQATEDVVPISLHSEEDDDDNAYDLIFTTEDTQDTVVPTEYTEETEEELKHESMHSKWKTFHIKIWIYVIKSQ